MTREEILKLEGQGLVEAVARNVMGCDPDIRNHFKKQIDWNPLTDENHLAEVRERMIERGYDVEIRWVGGHCKEWHCRFQYKKYVPLVDGKSYPVTLLRAALLAVHQEEEK